MGWEEVDAAAAVVVEDGMKGRHRNWERIASSGFAVCPRAREGSTPDPSGFVPLHPYRWRSHPCPDPDPDPDPDPS